MKRFHANVGSRNATLEERPEILKAILVCTRPSYVLSRMVNDLVSVIACQIFIRERLLPKLGIGILSGRRPHSTQQRSQMSHPPQPGSANCSSLSPDRGGF